MRSVLRSLVVTAVGLVVLWLPARGLEPLQYILFADPTLVGDVCSRHGLTEVTRIEGHGVCLAEAPADADEEDLDADLEGDLDITAFDRDRDVDLTESPAALSQSTAAILETLPDRTPVEFAGATAWNGYVHQTAGDLIKLDDAREYASTRPAIVAVIDTGVDAGHPLLGGVVLPGYDFTRDVAGEATDRSDLDQSTAAILEWFPVAPDVQMLLNQSTAAILEQSTAAILETLPPLPAAFGHGTLVAGLVHMVAPTASILPLKAFRADGTSRLFDIIRAVYYAADHGANVINMSFSMIERSKTLEQAMSEAGDLEIVLVASAGNQGEEAEFYPAAVSQVTGVASTDDADARSGFSNFGDKVVTVAAPGEALITTYPGGHYAAVWGTSFSAGLVSGAAALVHQVEPGPAREEVESSLRRADDVGDGLGKGRLNLKKAMKHRTK
jgi:subtilisin family serine protease